MIVRSLDSVRPQHLTGSGFSRVVLKILSGPRDGCNKFTTRLFTIQPGGHTPRDSAASERVFYVLSGTGECVDVDGFAREIVPGDSIVVPPWEMFHLQNRSSGDLSVLLVSAAGS
jgi:quercetin dioxygenase-like cupin family protein